MVLGDALLNAVISFQQPAWVAGSDQNPAEGVATRLELLDRLATDQTRIIGFHLPQPGLGRVERSGRYYRFIESAG
jgi:glyoxylase-like metal-dependent hydrolase (beta-lactamase superfamily II)